MLQLLGGMIMTLQQEAYEKIKILPDDGVKMIIVIADEIAKLQNRSHSSSNKQKNDKSQFYKDMLNMRNDLYYPNDFDYKSVVMEDITEKYGSFS
jgi:hypothetical protein